MSYVNSVAAYAGARATTPVRANPDYAVAQQLDKQTNKSPSDQNHPTFGPATRVTLSPEAVSYLQGQKTEQAKSDQAKSAQANRAEDDDAKAKAEKAAAERRAAEAKHTAGAKAASLG